jgi:hypothetical protein
MVILSMNGEITPGNSGSTLPLFSFNIKADGALKVVFCGDGTTASCAVEKVSSKVIGTTWAYVGMTITLDDSADKSTIRFWKDDSGDSEHTWTTSGEYFKPHSLASMSTFVGANFEGGSAGLHFVGFMYAFYIETKYYGTEDFPH